MTIAATSPLPSYHPTYARLLLAMLRAEGVDARPLLMQAGLTPEDLLSDNCFITDAHMIALVGEAVRQTRKPWLGLEFGVTAQVFMHGPVGYAAAASATLRQAVGVLTRFAGLRTAAFRLQLESHQRASDLVVVELRDLGEVRVVVMEAVLAIVVRLLQTLSGQPCTGLQLYLPWARPQWAARYAEAFGATSHFDAERLVLRLPAEVLDQACLTADADACAKALRDCEQLLGPQAIATPVADRLRARLQRCEGDYPTLAALAQEQAVSARTLMRKLKAEQTCYQDLLDQVRCERACWDLLHTDASLDAIAERLGLQNASNFSRSFQRWRGITPARYRATGGGAPSAMASGE